MFSSILSVLSKQFQFPEAESKKFSLKTHVDRKKCNLTIDREMMSIYASGPGQVSWKEKTFKKLAENMFRTYVKQTTTLLDTSMDIENVSISQGSTQGNEAEHHSLISNTTEEPQSEPPAEPVTKQPEQLEFTQLKDSPVIRQISALMDMISTLQGQINTLTKQVNYLVQEAANESLYRTVDQTNTSSTRLSESTLHQESGENEENSSNKTQNSPAIRISSSATDLPDLQTRQYSEVVTSTPIPHNQETPQRPQPAPRRTLRGSVPTTYSLRPAASQRPIPKNSDNSNQILMIGDSIISSVNPKGLRHNIFKNGIPGAKINDIYSQLKVFDMTKFSHVIIYGGGNDASSGSDSEYFEEIYEQLIQYIKRSNRQCKIILCNTCPRGDTSTTDLNEIIQRLSKQHHATLIDLDQAFHDRHGDIIQRYYTSDSIHLSPSGVKRLLGVLNKEVTIVNNFDRCVFPKRQQSRGHHYHSHSDRRNFHQKRRGSNDQHSEQHSNLCRKCGESNHATSRCRHKEQLKCFHCGLYGHKSGRCLTE